MAAALLLSRQSPADPLDGVIARPVSGSFRPIENGGDALTDAPGGFRFRKPNGRQGSKNVGRLDLADALLTHGRKNVGLEGVEPLRWVLLVFPPRATLLQSTERGLSERRNGRPGLTLGLDGIAAFSRALAIFEGLQPAFGQRNEAEPAEPHVSALAMHHCPKHPALRTRWVNNKV